MRQGTTAVAQQGTLAVEQPQFVADLAAADLRVADRGLNRGRAFVGHMPEVVGDLFERPPTGSRPVREVMAQIVKRHILDQGPFGVCSTKYNQESVMGIVTVQMRLKKPQDLPGCT